MIPFFANYYYIVLVIQALCAFHCIKKGNQNKWIWIIVFLPLVGCLIYLFTEVITNQKLSNIQYGLGAFLNPSGKIKRLEENLRFTDTFQNRIALADAYLSAGETDKAIELYEGSLSGNFIGNDQVNKQLMLAYYAKKRYEDVIIVAKKIYNQPQFSRSQIHTLYAISLGHTDDAAAAEKEFKLLNTRYSNYECRYQYGCFLLRIGRIEEAKSIFKQILDESTHLNPYEKRDNKIWFYNAKEELRKIA